MCLNEIAKDDHALCERVVDECFASEDYAEGRTALVRHMNHLDTA